MIATNWLKFIIHQNDYLKGDEIHFTWASILITLINRKHWIANWSTFFTNKSNYSFQLLININQHLSIGVKLEAPKAMVDLIWRRINTNCESTPLINKQISIEPWKTSTDSDDEFSSFPVGFTFFFILAKLRLLWLRISTPNTCLETRKMSTRETIIWNNFQ